jgi:hypothetical protein
MESQAAAVGAMATVGCLPVVAGTVLLPLLDLVARSAAVVVVPTAEPVVSVVWAA